jgi:hypothetical protein
MQTMISFGEVLEAVDKLSLEEQVSLIDILQRRIIERRRAELAEDIQEARKDFEEGRSKPATPSELMDEILL